VLQQPWGQVISSSRLVLSQCWQTFLYIFQLDFCSGTLVMIWTFPQVLLSFLGAKSPRKDTFSVLRSFRYYALPLWCRWHHDLLGCEEWTGCQNIARGSKQTNYLGTWEKRWYLDLSFLCTFVPRSEKFTERSLPWNFRSVDHLLPRSEKSKNFRSMEGSLAWNFRSSGGNVPRTFAPQNFRTCGTFVPQDRMFQELSFPGSYIGQDYTHKYFIHTSITFWKHAQCMQVIIWLVKYGMYVINTYQFGITCDTIADSCHIPARVGALRRSAYKWCKTVHELYRSTAMCRTVVWTYDVRLLVIVYILVAIADSQRTVQLH